MKKHLIAATLLGSLVWLSLNGQAYHPFPTAGAIWNSVGDNVFSGAQWEFRYGLYGDTVIDANTYSKVYQLADTTLIHPNSTYFGALREDDSHRVWLRMPGTVETLLYDFAALPGDTIWYEWGGALCGNGLSLWPQTPHYRVVVSVDSVLLLNNEYRKRWVLSGSGPGDIWVEGIGSISWYALLSPLLSDITLCGDSYSFACFKADDQVLWLQNANCMRCFCNDYMGLPGTGIPVNSKLIISPNPARDQVTVSLPDERLPVEISIYNTSGVKVGSFILQSPNGQSLSTSRYGSGQYILVARDPTGQLRGIATLIID